MSLLWDARHKWVYKNKSVFYCIITSTETIDITYFERYCQSDIIQNVLFDTFTSESIYELSRRTSIPTKYYIRILVRVLFQFVDYFVATVLQYKYVSMCLEPKTCSFLILYGEIS